MRKYQIAVFIIFLLTASVCFAYDFAGGTGEPNDPYQIETAAQLLQIGSDPNLLDKCYILINDINLDPNLTSIPPFTQAPIAPDFNNSNMYFDGISFTGIFDGNDKIIASLIIDTNGLDNNFLGLFGYLRYDCHVKNLGIEDIYIIGSNGSDSIGGLCGTNYGGTISNSFSTGSVTGYNEVGGLCGENYQGTIINCCSSCFVTGYNQVGGLCGINFANGKIRNCLSYGSVKGNNNSNDLGGLCGLSDGKISNCISGASVTGGNDSDYLGGLCGRSVRGSINNCFAFGLVTGSDYSDNLGGLCGRYSIGTINTCFSIGPVTAGDDSEFLGGLCGYLFRGTIYSCFSTGTVSGNSYLGSFCGNNQYGTINNCYSSGSVTGKDYVGGLCGNEFEGFINNSYFLDTAGPDNGLGTPLTDTQMKQPASFVNWDFVNETINGIEDIWTIKEGVKYPEHVWPLVQYHSWDGVDFADYSFFSNHWLLSDCNDINDCNSTDLDFSGRVDINDLNIFTTYWLFAK